MISVWFSYVQETFELPNGDGGTLKEGSPLSFLLSLKFKSNQRIRMVDSNELDPIYLTHLCFLL